MPLPKAEIAARAHLESKGFVAGDVNTSKPNTSAQNASIESALSLNGLTAKVLVKQGQACKIKWYNSTGKPVTSYYSKNFVQSEAVTFINAFMA